MRATDRPRARHVEAMDAEALQPLEHDAAVAQEILGDDRLGDVGTAPGGASTARCSIESRWVTKTTTCRLAMRCMLSISSSAVIVSTKSVNRMTSARRLQPGIELGEAEREIGLLVLIVELGGGALDAREARHAADRRQILPHARVEAVGADEVAAVQRDPGQQQAGVDGVIEPRHALDRLAHEIAGVEGQDDLMIALGAELLAQQLAMARRMLPVDEAVVEAGRVFAQRLELGALALLRAAP